MSEDLEKISVGRVDVGIDVFDRDFHEEFSLDTASKNLSMGINRGLGPRYGMSPIPGHVHNEDQETNVYGMVRGENVAIPRLKFFGIIPFLCRTYSDSTVFKNTYIWLASGTYNSATRLIVMMGVDYNAGSLEYANSIVRGIGTYGSFVGYDNTIYQPDLPVTDANVTATTIDSSKTFVSFAIVSVSGKSNPAEWMIATNYTDPTGTNAGDWNTNAWGVLSPFSSGSYDSITKRRIEVFSNIYSTAPPNGLDRRYIHNAVTLGSVITSSRLVTTTATVSFAAAAITADSTVAGANATAGYSAATYAAIRIDGMRHETNYSVVFVAADKAIGVIYNMFEQASLNAIFSAIVDPCSFAPNMFDYQTIASGGGAYSEDGTAKTTCWYCWPSYTRGTPLTTHAVAARANSQTNQHVTLGAANTGILRANTTYEISFAVYDKSLDYETNVGKPAKIQTGTDDYVALTILRASQNAGVNQDRQLTYHDYAPLQYYIAGSPTRQHFGFSRINYTRIKFYYRAEGSYEWLPAGEMDMAQWVGESNYDVRYICTGEQAGIPGGQPSGFIDNSKLPSAKYIDVKNFKGRTFWISRDALYFSLRNKPFTYPLRNSVAAPTGTFSGCTLHNYPGLTELGSRIVVWGSSEAYIGRFTGNYQQMPVRVSATEVGYFDLDGSDFVLESWTSHTAFSHRSAVVAQGVLYWWGPDGVYKDVADGEIPPKISAGLEPDIFDYYDPTQTDKIHATYSDSTKEIIWFYLPKDGDGSTTRGLVYNVLAGEFLHFEWDGIIDSSQTLTIEKDDSPSGLSGKRVIVGTRASTAATVSRPFFFDHRNRSGDIFPTQELMVKTVAAGTNSNQRTFTLQVGYDATLYSNIAVGDNIVIHQAKKYATSMTDADDCIAVVASKPGAGQLMVTLPDGVDFDTSASLTYDKYFPIWHQGTHDISYLLKSAYWAPKGVTESLIWRYLHMIMKVALLPSVDDQTITAQYRTPVMPSGDYQGGTITLENNCDGNMHRLHQLEGMDLDGPALQILLSGSHIASEWVLQYLAAHVGTQGWDYEKTFEE